MRAEILTAVLTAGLAGLLMHPAAAGGRPGEVIELARASAPGLGGAYEDKNRGFSISPPGGWYVDSKTRRFAVRFSSRDYHAFMTVDVIDTGEAVRIDREFARFVNDRNKEVKNTFGGFKVIANTKTRINSQSAYHTEASFQAGPNLVMMDIYYVAGADRLYMIATTYPELESRTYQKLLERSVKTFQGYK